jgi:hypothetical protein
MEEYGRCGTLDAALRRGYKTSEETKKRRRLTIQSIDTDARPTSQNQPKTVSYDNKVFTISADDIDQRNKAERLIRQPEFNGYEVAASFPSADFSKVVIILQKP